MLSITGAYDMTVRAKFKCDSVTTTSTGGQNKRILSQIVLTPVTTGSKENEKMFEYTPGGKLELSVLNAKAAETFIPGNEYYIDISLALTE